MRTLGYAICTAGLLLFLNGCMPDSYPPPAPEMAADPDEFVETPEPEATPTPDPAATPTATPTATLEGEGEADERAEAEDEVDSPRTMLRSRRTHRDGTTAIFEFTEPRLLRFESTELTLTCDGRVCLAVFPDMRAYAIIDAPREYTIQALADLSPVLEPTLMHYEGLAIPQSIEGAGSEWTPAEEEFDRARFSTEAPRFYRDITSQVARPVGDYAANRLIGQSLPYFEVRGLDGTTISSADFEGQAMLIDFWATWCPPCLESMPKLDALDQRYGNAGLAVLGMNMDEGTNAVRDARQFVSSHGFGFQQAVGESAAVDFRVQVLPTLFLVDREHVIRNVYIGVPPEEEILRGEVEQLMR